MPLQRVTFEETLKKHVIDSLLCTGCASCVISCPFNCLEYAEGSPRLISECKVCGICAQICPKFNLSIPDLERFIFNRERSINEEFGVYKRVLVTQTTSSEIMSVCQDGGVVTSLLTFALEEGIIDGAVLSGGSLDKPLKGVPKLALSKNDILECAGTKYTYSPNMLALRDGVRRKIGKLAFVGTPCQIHAIRRIQMLPLKKYANPVKFTIGLFCSESFTYEGLINQILKAGIKPDDVIRINIKGKLLLKMRNGEVKALPLKDFKASSCVFCNTCLDFSAELADISAGGLGLEGWTLTIVRSEIGDELFSKAESRGVIRAKPLEDKNLLDLLIKISRRKRERNKAPT
ncbi:MAG: Coenzyme F420 hydrogenase/dehydrogenase, beta subunit C-terminal domain [Candidatus Bathyarchaeia archaeon]